MTENKDTGNSKPKSEPCGCKTEIQSKEEKPKRCCCKKK